MKTKLSVYFTCLFFLLQAGTHLTAQVTIGSDKTPEAYSTLEIDGQQGGMRLPQLTTTQRTTLQAKFASNPTGSIGLVIYNTTDKEVQYWDGTQWVAAKGGGGSITIPTEPWFVSGSTTQATSNTENIYQMGQVSIGNSGAVDASAILRVDATNKGVLFPKVTLTGTTDNTTITSPSTGLLVYNTGTNPGFPAAGYVIWDGGKWTKISTDVEIPTEPWKVSGGTTDATSNTQNIYQMGSVAIGHDGAVDPTAILNVQATNKGVLLPRVALKSSTDKITIPNPTKGLLVYNTGTDPSFSTVGYMFWDGFAWKIFANGSSESASAILNCAGAGMSPSQQVVGGTPIVSGTVLQIPYTGSNGGSFNGATLTSVGNPGVTATIAGGMLAVGNGVLNFSLSGTPLTSQQAPNGIVFDLTDFLAANTGITGCDEVVVGNTLTASVETTAVMGFLMATTDSNGAEGYGLQCNSPDGKFSVRVWIPKLAIYNNITAQNGAVPNVQLRNNMTSTVKIIWNDITFYSNGAAAPISANGVMNVPAQVWGGNNNVGGSIGNQWVNNSSTSNGGHFGQVGIYDGSGNGPEYRRYTWIPIGENQKTSYEMHVMAAIDNPSSNTSGTPTQVKVYIKFEQVTAQ